MSASILEAKADFLIETIVQAASQTQRPGDSPALATNSDAQAFGRLAKLPAADYDRQREGEAARMGIRVGTLDAEVKTRRGSDGQPNADGGTAFTLDAPEPWPCAVDGAELITELSASICKHVVLPAGAADAVALWAVHTHAHEAAQVSPIAAISSPTHGCGKSTLLAWLGAVVPKPLPASNITTAALFRAVEKWRPTMLVDEADTFLGASDDLRGIINSGHARANAFVIRTVGEGHEPRVFSTWAPKAIAAIGKMHPTLTSRSIVIELRRKGAGETVEPLRQNHHAELDVLRRKAARWAADNHDRLHHAEPDMPDGLINRGADNWLALLAIADAAGGGWPARARKAAVALSAGRSDESHSAVLLDDIKALFDERKADRLASADIVAALTAREDRPWPEWRDGRPLTTRQLAKLLEPFGIRPGARRDGKVVFKGYVLESFIDAFARYLVPPAVTTLQVSTGAVLRDSVSVTQSGAVTDAKAPKASTGAGCNAVTDREPGDRQPEHKPCTSAWSRELPAEEDRHQRPPVTNEVAAFGAEDTENVAPMRVSPKAANIENGGGLSAQGGGLSAGGGLCENGPKAATKNELGGLRGDVAPAPFLDVERPKAATVSESQGFGGLRGAGAVRAEAAPGRPCTSAEYAAARGIDL